MNNIDVTTQSLIEFDGISIVILFGLIQILIIGFLFGFKKRFLQHRQFVWVLIVICVAMTESFFLRSGLMSKHPHFLNIAAPFIFLMGPSMYFYILSQFETKLKLKTKIFHLLPFIFYLIYSFNFFLQSAHFKYNIYVRGFRPNVETTESIIHFSTDPWQIQGWVVVELLSLHLLIYSFISFYKIRQQSKLKLNSNKEKIRWAYYIAGITALVSLVLFFSQGGVINGKVFFKSPFPNYSSDLFSTVVAYLMTIYILSKPDHFKLNLKKYSKSSLSSQFKKEKLKTLIDHIESNKLYLNQGFSLKMLSSQSGLSTHHISQIFNEELNSTFFEVSNKYRILEAKKRLQASDDYIKMEQLAYDLGYKSKSTFFTAFKKETNLTPSKYRETLEI